MKEIENTSGVIIGDPPRYMPDSPRLTPEQPSRPPRAPRRKAPVALIVGGLVALVLVFGTAYAGARLGNETDVTRSSTTNTAKTDGNAVVTESEAQISSIAEKVSPSVVSIVATSGSSGSGSIYNYLNGGSGGVTGAAGTGIIVSADGYVMTNEHVIDGAQNVSVQLNDGTTYDDVTVVGRDPLNDLAFLKIKNVSDLKPATIGNSSTLRQGQTVVAIGNALGQYQNTVTSGIVSGVGRPVVAGSEDSNATETLEDLIQTDAAINSGNSGGPLVNLEGQVIGINTAVASDAQSIGFAIPINATKGVLEGVLKNGKIARAYLGVAYVNVTPAVQKQYGLSVARGAYVYAQNGASVVADSPAAKAGIKDKDIITKVNDDTVGEAAGLSTLLAQYTPGTTVTLTVLRDGQPRELKAELTQYQN